ncbi:uncharacterized protein L3040_005017 [Drepanopeziza brunnea f. sp. 'multigermtubi']|uniref:uncharacterized protein n=1 Tax=Drepanopeziza brunnea f. sp. 'multigermtubi' TaxID=698441 RepID=UPI002396CFED|nr:hypothetical protein L3040_005017 [Drepanopeziza brunnea f. sp. 'multigermtubi']
MSRPQDTRPCFLEPAVTMAPVFDSVSEPIPISLISGRYMLFDVNVVTYLRRTHHICGTLMGTLPQSPQQNLFFGMPMELMPEEAKLLVEKGVAYILDDKQWHKTRLLNTLQGADKQAYLKSLRTIVVQARKVCLEESQRKTKYALAMKAAREIPENANDLLGTSRESHASDPDPSLSYPPSTADSADVSLFEPKSNASSRVNNRLVSTGPVAATLTISYHPSSLPQNPGSSPDPSVSSSYALFAHLHARGYYLMPGLRFGCNYNVYPGDPLRFHSHFLATSYDFDQDIPLFDIIGGGRLGTAVKKGFLIGGVDPGMKESKSGENVRTFCIEWAASSLTCISLSDRITIKIREQQVCTKSSNQCYQNSSQVISYGKESKGAIAVVKTLDVDLQADEGQPKRRLGLRSGSAIAR